MDRATFALMEALARTDPVPFVVRQAHHERSESKPFALSQPEQHLRKYPFAPSLSKGERRGPRPAPPHFTEALRPRGC